MERCWREETTRKGGGNTLGELTLQVLYQNYLLTSVSFGLKKYYDMHYMIFLFVKTSYTLGSLGKIKVWISFSPWIFFYIIDFFYQSPNDNWMRIWFFNIAIIIFYLMYSLNVPHSTQNTKFVSVDYLVSISSKFISWWYFTLPCWYSDNFEK